MINKQKTLKERRAESDSRIIASAVKCFGEKGYAQCTVMEIAKGAGVTSGLVIQRFESKENLFVTSYRTVVYDNFTPTDDYALIGYRLIKIIDQVKVMQEKDPAAFQFIRTILNSSDIPSNYIQAKKEQFEAQSIAITIKESQEKGLVAKGDVFYLFQSFLSQVFNKLDSCKKYGLECPPDNFFLSAFQIADKENQKREKQKEAMLEAICRTFDALVYIYLNSNTAEHMRLQNNVLPFENINNARESITKLVYQKIDDSYLDAMLEFTNLDTLDQRLTGNNILLKKCLLKNGTAVVITIIPTARAIDGKITEILIGIQTIGYMQGE